MDPGSKARAPKLLLSSPKRLFPSLCSCQLGECAPTIFTASLHVASRIPSLFLSPIRTDITLFLIPNSKFKRPDGRPSVLHYVADKCGAGLAPGGEGDPEVLRIHLHVSADVAENHGLDDKGAVGSKAATDLQAPDDILVVPGARGVLDDAPWSAVLSRHRVGS